MAQTQCACGEGLVTARLRQPPSAVISQGSGMLRLRLKLRYNGWDAGTAAAGEPGARRAAAVEASGHAWRGRI